MEHTLPISLTASVMVQQWARLAGLQPQHTGERWLLHLTPMPPVALSGLTQTTTLQLIWSGLIWQLISISNTSDYYDQYQVIQEICFDAQRQHYWQLQSCPLAQVSVPLLEHCLEQLQLQIRLGQAVIRTDPLPSPSATSHQQPARRPSPHP